MEATASVTRPLSPVVSLLEICYPAKSTVLLPLSFGRVNDGRPVTSQTLLFRLPIELVEEVVTYLDTADLRSLALVDRDCRQLARARLFTSVTLEYSDEKWTLLDELSHHEARSRRDNDGVTEGPSIGACIRRVTVAKQSRGIGNRHRILSPTNDSISKEEKCVMHDAVCNYCGTYLPDIANALRFSLPNLDEFIWLDSESVPHHMQIAIASSPIRHLSLRDVRLSLNCEYLLPPLEQQRWALRSLELGAFLYPHSGWRSRDVSKFCITILKAAAPTLEKLSWRGYLGGKLSFGNSAIRFPRLRTLSFATGCMPDDTALDAFFPSDAENYALYALSVNIPVLHGRGSLAQRGRIRGLESMRLHTISRNPHDSRATDAALLSANPHLKSLTLLATSTEKLTTTLLPLLASEFKFLTTLIVYFTLPIVHPSDFFAAIGEVTSLVSLWIVGGDRCDWTDDVARTIAALSPLRNLARLGLSERCTGITPPLLPEPGDRYKERMRNIVELYVRALKKLRWVYFGQLVHKVVGDVVVTGEGGLRHYSPEGLWESPYW